MRHDFQCSNSQHERGASDGSCLHGILQGHGTHTEDGALNSVL